MNIRTRTTLLIAAGLSLPAVANAQFIIDWSTIDCGGGNTAGGTFALSGTIGQPDATTPLTGGAFSITGGFWVVAGAPPACYANCDGSTAPPVLNALDFSCFLARFRQQDPYANCDSSTAPPVLNALDFSCYLNRYVAGCP